MDVPFVEFKLLQTVGVRLQQFRVLQLQAEGDSVHSGLRSNSADGRIEIRRDGSQRRASVRIQVLLGQLVPVDRALVHQILHVPVVPQAGDDGVRRATGAIGQEPSVVPGPVAVSPVGRGQPRSP